MHVSASPTPRSKSRPKAGQHTPGPHLLSTLEADRSTHSGSGHHRGGHNNHAGGQLEPVHEEKVEQPVNPPANNAHQLDNHDNRRCRRRGDGKNRGRQDRQPDLRE
uniref:Uncharacterized protein n=1 Tax=Setaria italica TaxID=4555 RepID=K3ZYB2_SETIT